MENEIMAEKEFVGYVVLDNQSEFEQWQLENDDFKIVNVMPGMTNISQNVDKNVDNTDISNIPKWGVIVTYMYTKVVKCL